MWLGEQEQFYKKHRGFTLVNRLELYLQNLQGRSSRRVKAQRCDIAEQVQRTEETALTAKTPRKPERGGSSNDMHIMCTVRLSLSIASFVLFR